MVEGGLTNGNGGILKKSIEPPAYLLEKIDKLLFFSASSKGVSKFNHLAALFSSKGRLLLWETNQEKTHPIMSVYTKGNYLHAEAALLVRYDSLRLSTPLQHCTLLSIRSSRTTPVNLLKAEPCPNCRQLLLDREVGAVWFSNRNGGLEQLW